MKKIITIVLLSLSCFYCSAQELQTTKKENIYTVIPNVENLFVLMNCTLDQFESTMKKYKYYERNSRGNLVTYWNGESLDAHLANAEINWFSYFAGNTNNKSIVCQIVIPESGLVPQSSANLLRQVRPFYQKNADGADVFLFNYKGQAVGVFLSYTESYVNVRMSSFGSADSRLIEMK